MPSIGTRGAFSITVSGTMPAPCSLGDNTLPREHERHVVEHRAGHREERLHRHTQPQLIDQEIHRDQRHRARRNLRP
jgi:hypothetical protein